MNETQLDQIESQLSDFITEAKEFEKTQYDIREIVILNNQLLKTVVRILEQQEGRFWNELSFDVREIYQQMMQRLPSVDEMTSHKNKFLVGDFSVSKLRSQLLGADDYNPVLPSGPKERLSS